MVGFTATTPVRAEWIRETSRLVWSETGGEVIGVEWSEEQSAPTIRPLRIPGGLPLLGAPGLSLRWASINGIDYTGADDVAADRRGVVRWREPVIEMLPDGGCVVRQRIDYLHPSGRRELAEYRDLVISEIGRNGKYHLDWTSHFTAGEAGAVLVDDDACRSGLHLTLAVADSPAEFMVTPLSSTAAQGDGDAAADDTFAFSQAVAVRLHPDVRHPGSVAMLADPRSTRGPHAWRLVGEGDRRRLVATILGGTPRKLEPGEVWELSYRVVVRPKHWDAEDLRLELFRWLRR